MRIVKVQSPSELPSDWDSKCISIFQTRAFLAHCNEFNPCNQRFYLFYSDSIFIGGAIVYSLKIDILTFLKIPSPLVMHVVGVPCSVSCSGIIGEDKNLKLISDELTKREKGFLLFLNSNKPFANEKLADGRTWPTVLIEHTFASWKDYCSGMRHEYRRRLKLVERFASSLTIEEKPLEIFSENHYSLYLNVFNRSSGKLEKLTKCFFENLPSSFILTNFSKEDRLLGWTISTSHNGTFYFFLGGQDYSFEPRMVYLAKVLHIVKNAVETGHLTIDLGQSAETSKLRFGGKVSERYMGAHHSNNLFNAVIHRAKKLLSYNKTFVNPSVFSVVDK